MLLDEKQYYQIELLKEYVKLYVKFPKDTMNKRT